MKKRYKLLILVVLAGFIYLMFWSNFNYQNGVREQYEQVNTQ